MDLPVSWLREWLPGLDMVPERIAAQLEQMGYELDGVVTAEAGLAAVQLGEVLERHAHPAADRLAVLLVADGGGEPVQVVTGAPNGHPGDRVWYAPPGTTLPDGRVLGTEHLRGVRSEGMLLSARELGYVGGGEGLWIWQGPGKVGERWPTVVGSETVLQLSLTPNLAQYDHSVLGVARDLAARDRAPLPAWPASPRLAGDEVLVRLEAPDLCPRYAVALLECATPSGTMPWVWQRRLALAGVRLIHPVVDATNAVRIDMGQPLHAFDRDRVRLPLVVRRAAAGEPLVLLDGRTVTLDPDDLVIADGDGPVALAGVMGGQRSAVTADTRRVLLESAHFSRAGVYRTARRHQLVSDAAARFGRGTDVEAVLPAVGRFVDLLHTFGVNVAGGAVQVVGPVPTRRHVLFQPARLRIWTGLDLDDEALAGELDRSGFILEAGRVRVPSWRPDIEGPQDLAEEVIRLVGMDAVPARLPARATPGVADPDTRQTDQLRDWLVAGGFVEVVSRSFVPSGVSERLGLAPAVHVVKNPLREDEAVMRTSVWPGLLDAARYNRGRGSERLALFEVGPVYLGTPAAPRERVEAGVLATLGEWPALFGASRQSVYDLKGLVEELSRRLGWRFDWGPWTEPAGALHPGRALAIVRDGQVWGALGELHPAVLQAWRLPRTAVARWHVPPVMAGQRRDGERPVPPPPYPAVRRDVSLLVPDGMPWAHVAALLQHHAGADVESIRPFDRYVDLSGTAVTVAIRYRAADRTLTDADVEARQAVLVSALAEAGIVRR